VEFRRLEVSIYLVVDFFNGLSASYKMKNPMQINDNKPLALICGAGTGLGAAVVTAFANNGYQVVGFNRSKSLELSDELDIRQLDCSDARAVEPVIAEIVATYGAPEVYVHNPAHLVISSFSETSVEQYEAAWRSMALSAFIMMQEIVPHMVKEGRGNIIVSGATASIKGSNRFSAFASAKFALRGLIQSVAREYQAQGVHAVHVLLDGIIDTPASRELHSLDPAKMMSPTDVAQLYLSLTLQPSTAWTHELDLRPQSENF